MKISYNWLKQYVSTDLPAEELGKLLTDCGLEVESIDEYQSIRGGLKGLLVGEVITCEKHPDADRLHVTQVNIGTDTLLPIVCGAPNVAAGQKVIVATVGTVLYSGEESFVIKKSKIRGKESEGMICAEDEIGLGKSHDGIMVLPEQACVGMSAAEYFKVENDFIFEIGLTPNRSDATSHIGVARDISAMLEIRKGEAKKLLYPSVDSFDRLKKTEQTQKISIHVEDPQACPRYCGIQMNRVKVAESPECLRRRLLSIGLRPINNVVDISNYVLWETGQALHIFDAKKIEGSKVVIRKAKKQEKITTLDGIERELSEHDLVICDTSKPLCIAGVFGGQNSGVSESTTEIFIESAYFDPISIRKTSKLHALKTDASFRYERGADPSICQYALKRAAILLQEIAGAELASPIEDHYPTPIEAKKVILCIDKLNIASGHTFAYSEVKNILEALEIKCRDIDQNTLEAEVPSNKPDVYRDVDIYEEILRIFGYNRIHEKERLDYALSYPKKPNLEKVQNQIADYLCHNGFYEIMNNSLCKSEYNTWFYQEEYPQAVYIANPLSRDLQTMRSQMVFGGLESIAHNIRRKATNLKFFEFGRTYTKNLQASSEEKVEKKYTENPHLAIWITGNQGEETWEKADKSSDVYFMKSLIENILSMVGSDRKKIHIDQENKPGFEYSVNYLLGEKVLLSLGKISPPLCKHFDIKQEVFYADIHWDRLIKTIPSKTIEYSEISKFPEVRRDLALLLDKNIAFQCIENIAFQCEKKILRSVSLFDVYQGTGLPENKKSYAIAFILQDDEKTLTDKQIDKIMAKILFRLTQELGAELR